MSRLVLILILATQAASAAACTVAGTAFDVSGRPLRDAVVRLVDLQTGHATFIAADAQASFAFDGVVADHALYRLDVLSPPTVVTGTRIPTRSILGMSDSFSCASQAMRQDVHVQVY